MLYRAWGARDAPHLGTIAMAVGTPQSIHRRGSAGRGGPPPLWERTQPCRQALLTVSTHPSGTPGGVSAAHPWCWPCSVRSACRSPVDTLPRPRAGRAGRRLALKWTPAQPGFPSTFARSLAGAPARVPTQPAVVLQPAASCPWWNPICLIAEGLDALWDDVTSVLALTWDIITLNPEEAFEDFAEIAYNDVCNQLTILSLVVSHGLEADFEECASPPHPIEPAVQVMLRRYIHSSLDSVRIHEGCHLDADVIPGEEAPHRGAITFGGHIILSRDATIRSIGRDGAVRPRTNACPPVATRGRGIHLRIWAELRVGPEPVVRIQRKADEYQASVLDDQYHDSDGIFTQVDHSPTTSFLANGTRTGMAGECVRPGESVRQWRDPPPGLRGIRLRG